MTETFFNKTIRQSFDVLNKELFDNELKIPYIAMQYANSEFPNVIAYFSKGYSFQFHGFYYEIRYTPLFIDYIKVSDSNFFVEVLLHEMVHQLIEQRFPKHSENPKFHDILFYEQAIKHNLLCSYRDDENGYCDTKLKDNMHPACLTVKDILFTNLKNAGNKDLIKQ